MVKFKVHSLIDKVYKRLNLYIAWEKVKANKGASGIDRTTIEAFEENREVNLEEIHRLLYEDKYQPQSVRRVWIPKANGDKRPLGIPTVRDRIVQQALLNRMEKIFEGKFLDCSYGFRPGRSCKQAIEKVEEHLNNGYQWVVEVDIEKCFDRLDHQILLNEVYEEISDGRVLRLIKKFLEAGVMEEMEVRYQTSGTPQGGVISPLLANICLHPFDQKMTQAGYKVVRYADDMVILCQGWKEAERVLKEVREILEGELKLRLNAEKTKITHWDRGFQFLGYVFKRGYKYPRYSSQNSFKEKVIKNTRRTQPKSMLQVIEKLNPIIRGWGNYFAYGNCWRLFNQLDYWIKRRVRAFKAKKWADLAVLEKFSDSRLKEMGLVSLTELYRRKQQELFSVKEQRLRKAEYGKSVCSV